MADNYRNIIRNIGVPRLIIFGFFLALCFAATPLGLDIYDLLSNVIQRVGMNGILVLAMVPAIQCGITLNFGLPLGIVGGLLGALISIELGFTGFQSFFVAIAIGVVFSAIIGMLYGMFLNNLKGSEMTVSTYVGFSVIAFMNIGWLMLPFKNPRIGWALGTGLRNTIDLSSSFGKILTEFLSFTLFNGKVTIPTGLLLFLAFNCFLVHLFLNSKTGVAMSAVGINPKFAESSGINVNKMRIMGTTISTIFGAVGILTYAQTFGFLQLYNGPMMMAFGAVAAVLIGGASIKRARISHVIIGTFLFQGVLSIGLPVANKILPEGNLSEIMRLIISNGIILYALTKAKGGDR